MIKLFLIDIRNYFRFLIFKSRWCKTNKHNKTIPGNVFPINKVDVGNETYGCLVVRCFHDCDSKLLIGHYCSIASNVIFELCAEHDSQRIITYPFETQFLNKAESGMISKGNIVIGDDVWISENVTILSGVNIGQGSIVAACALVTKDVPPYSIVGGVPARVIKYRFGSAIIEELLKIDYSKICESTIKRHVDELCGKLEDKTQLSWLPMKDLGEYYDNGK